MKGQSEEIRKLAVSAYTAGKTARELSEIFVVSSRTIYRWVKEAKEGQTAGKKRGHRPRCLSPEEEQRLDNLVLEKPDKTLSELRDDLQKQCSLPTIMRALVRLGYKVKKNSKGQRAKSRGCCSGP
jgi:transposase